jgi:hypothetical protein
MQSSHIFEKSFLEPCPREVGIFLIELITPGYIRLNTKSSMDTYEYSSHRNRHHRTIKGTEAHSTIALTY